MKRTTLLITVTLFIVCISLKGQSKADTTYRYFAGSTLFILANFADDPEPPHYFQLNLGYRITPKDVISTEIIRWDYYEPLGVPLGKKQTATNFPGKVRAFGAGLAYKRFIWKRVYTQIHSTLLRQKYLDEQGKQLGKGIQLFNTVRVGYQFRLFKNRLFIEPSIAVTFWPVNTNLPPVFHVEENKWNSYFIGEPGLHFGFNF